MHLFTRKDEREFRELTDRLAKAEAENRVLRSVVKMANVKVAELQEVICQCASLQEMPNVPK